VQLSLRGHPELRRRTVSVSFIHNQMSDRCDRSNFKGDA
jgi:hypothetical protein